MTIKTMNSNIDTDYEIASLWIPSQRVDQVHIGVYRGIEEIIKTKLGHAVNPVLDHLWVVDDSGKIVLYVKNAHVFQQVLQASFNPTGDANDKPKTPEIFIGKLAQPGKSFLWQPPSDNHPGWKLALQIDKLLKKDSSLLNLPPELTEPEPF